jgi:hypothetical protein
MSIERYPLRLSPSSLCAHGGAAARAVQHVESASRPVRVPFKRAEICWAADFCVEIESVEMRWRPVQST